jgi:PIN domain nuclease of toxin-antitoxin system
VADLPLHHIDPFDRLLIAQAISEPLHLLTADAQLKPYSELVILA